MSATFTHTHTADDDHQPDELDEEHEHFEDADETPEPSVTNLLQHDSLKWIFVGGKGGVGKTTCACSLGLLLARIRESVLILSTDPAHNVSDAFNQKFSRHPTPVKGVPNLFAMEIDPSANTQDMRLDESGHPLGGLMGDLINAIPGIDEAMSFAELMSQVERMEFSVIIFDTAPTGHTLRLLSFPTVLQKGLAHMITLKSRFGGLMGQFSSMFGADDDVPPGMMEDQLEHMQAVIAQVNEQFRDSERTTFVCVCIAEFLSVYETERLVQELAKFGIDTHNLIINQLIPPRADDPCRICSARRAIQRKYIEQIEDLYEDFNVSRMCLLPEEVRGVPALTQFAEMLQGRTQSSSDVDAGSS